MFDHKSIFCRPGPRLSEVFNNDVFGSQMLKGNLTAFISAREKSLDGLMRSLCHRFAYMEEGVLEATQIASLQNWPDTDDTSGEYNFKSAVYNSFWQN